MRSLLLKTAAGSLAVAGLAKGGFVMLKMPHFSPVEFGGSLPFLAFGLLEKLEAFRQELGRPVMISPAAGSLWRPTDPKSQHFFGRAADVMLPQGPGLEQAAEVAASVGFSGIGIYPDWMPYPGLHLDIRPGGAVARWGAVRRGGRQVYISFQAAMDAARLQGVA